MRRPPDFTTALHPLQSASSTGRPHRGVPTNMNADASHELLDAHKSGGGRTPIEVTARTLHRRRWLLGWL